MPLDKKKLQNIFSDESNEVTDYFSSDDGTANYTQEEEESDEIQDSLPIPRVTRDVNAKEVTQETVNADVDYSLRAIGDMINQAQKLVQMSLENVANNGTPRDTEVAAGAIDTAVNAAEKLISIHEKLQKIKSPVQSNQNTMYVQNQNVFHGTTADAIRALKRGEIEI